MSCENSLILRTCSKLIPDGVYVRDLRSCWDSDDEGIIWKWKRCRYFKSCDKMMTVRSSRGKSESIATTHALLVFEKHRVHWILNTTTKTTTLYANSKLIFFTHLKLRSKASFNKFIYQVLRLYVLWNWMCWEEWCYRVF